MSHVKTQARLKRVADDNEVINAALNKMRSWSELTQTVAFPRELVPALLTGRPELIANARPEAMDAEGVGKLFLVIGALMETNMALQLHSQRTAQRCDQLYENLKGLMSGVDRLSAFANFDPEPCDDLEDAA